MKHLADKKQCTGCTSCANSCPKCSITMVRNAEGFSFPEIDSGSCVDCGACRSACPVLHGKKESRQNTIAYAAYTKNPKIRKESTSGGLFSELASEILNRGGAVYGAAYDENFRVVHQCIENSEALAALRGAKYAQSELGDCFSDIRKRLKNGQKVLFSGTPCQVAGLKAFLKKDDDNLFCVDLVCHGVPSPMVWESYVRYRAERDSDGLMPESVNLRCKDSGWSRYAYSVDFTYPGGARYLKRNGEDEFMQMFVGDYVLRESCGNCPEKGYDRKSDITLGDFWGIWDIDPGMDDNKGTSLLLTHSEKGEKLLGLLKDRIQLKKVEAEDASRMNPAMLKSVTHKKERQETLAAISSGGFQPLNIPDNERTGLKTKVKNKVKSLIRKVSKN